MRVWAPRLLGLGALLIFQVCQQAPPDLEQALSLYREGQINEARRDMVAYIRAKPFNPEVDEARQHILLIRRIKLLESVAVEQWRKGNLQGAKKIVGVLHFMHPVYVDSAEIFRLINFDQPPIWLSDTLKIPVPARFDPADSTIRELIPYARAALGRQQEAIILIARAWETAKYSCKDNPMEFFTASILEPAIQEMIQSVDSACKELRSAGGQSNPLTLEIDRLSDQFHQFIIAITPDTLQPLPLFEYDFQERKRDLLTQTLALKSRLTPGEAGPAAAADTTALRGS